MVSDSVSAPGLLTITVQILYQTAANIIKAVDIIKFSHEHFLDFINPDDARLMLISSGKTTTPFGFAGGDWFSMNYLGHYAFSLIIMVFVK
jgi:hypothetical protein